MVENEKETVTSKTEKNENGESELTEEQLDSTDDQIENNTEEEEESMETSSEQEEEDINKLREQLNEYKEKYEALEAEKKQLTDRMLRIQADYDNFKRRTEKERIAERKYQAQDLATELLPVIDNFERALQTDVSDENKGFKDGMVMIYEQLQNALKSQGIEADRNGK